MEEENAPTFKESLDNSLVELHESPTLTHWLSATGNVVGTLIGASLGIPIPLGEAAQWTAGRGEVIARRRTERFLSSLSERLAAVETLAIEPGFFDSEYWHDLFRKAFEEALKTRSNDKIEYLAQILKGAVIDSVRGDYSSEEYLYLVSDLTIQELTVAGHLYQARPQYEDRAWEAWRKDVSTEIGLEVRDLQLTLARLSTTGLIVRLTGGRDEHRDYTDDQEDPAEIGYYAVTPAFEKLAHYLELEQHRK